MIAAIRMATPTTVDPIETDPATPPPTTFTHPYSPPLSTAEATKTRMEAAKNAAPAATSPATPFRSMNQGTYSGVDVRLGCHFSVPDGTLIAEGATASSGACEARRRRPLRCIRCNRRRAHAYSAARRLNPTTMTGQPGTNGVTTNTAPTTNRRNARRIRRSRRILRPRVAAAGTVAATGASSGKANASA